MTTKKTCVICRRMSVPAVSSANDLKGMIDELESMRVNIEDHLVGAYASGVMDIALGEMRVCELHAWQVDELLHDDTVRRAMRRLRPIREGLRKQLRLTPLRRRKRT